MQSLRALNRYRVLQAAVVPCDRSSCGNAHRCRSIHGAHNVTNRREVPGVMPYDGPAGGRGALRATVQAVRQQMETLEARIIRAGRAGPAHASARLRSSPDASINSCRGCLLLLAGRLQTSGTRRDRCVWRRAAACKRRIDSRYVCFGELQSRCRECDWHAWSAAHRLERCPTEIRHTSASRVSPEGLP